MRGAERLWPSICNLLEAAIAARPVRAPTSHLPGPLPCPGFTGTRAPAMEGLGASLGPRAYRTGPSHAVPPAHVCTPVFEMG